MAKTFAAQETAVADQAALLALPSGTRVRHRVGDIGVIGLDEIHYPECAPLPLAYAVKHWAPFEVLGPVDVPTVEEIAAVLDAQPNGWRLDTAATAAAIRSLLIGGSHDG